MNEQDPIYKELMIQVLAGYIIIPAMDKTKHGATIGRKALANDLYQFLNNNFNKLKENDGK